MNLRPLLSLLLLLSLGLLSTIAAAAEAARVSPGDVIAIYLPGEALLNQNLTVDREGRVLLPEVGFLKVAGLTESALSAQVTQSLALSFRDLERLQVQVFERRLLVSVLGYVAKPGEVNLPAHATIQQALQAAGGLRAGAQLDRMQIQRGGGRVNFDYKAYLDSGNEALLPTLETLDTLFIPASPRIGNIERDFDASAMSVSGDAAEERSAIKVFGEVNSPGSYAWKEGTTLMDMLLRAGGVTRYAGVTQIRVIAKGEPVQFNLKRYLESGDDSLQPELQPGATLFVPRQEEEIEKGANTLYVMGEVFKPGAYESKPDATFMDILANAGGPTRYADGRQIRILRANGRVEPFDLSGYTEGTGSRRMPVIHPGDALFVPEKTDVNEKSWLKVAPNRAVRVMGEVERPGRYEWSNEMDLIDLLAHAGGPTSKADTARIEVVAPQGQGRARTHYFDLDAYLAGERSTPLPAILAGAIIRVHELPQDPTDNKSQWVRQSSESSIYVFGQVGAPGRYRFTEAMNFLDILSAADGPTERADIHNIRISHRSEGHARVTELNLARYFETGDEALLPKVTTGDTIYIPEKSRSWLDEPVERTVRVLGAVSKPGRYRFDDRMTLLDLLAEAGGQTENALVEKITVVSKSCCETQARTFDLDEFGRTGDFRLLPVLRAGDTVYVPSERHSTGSQARQGLDDLFKIITMGALVGVI